MAESVEVRDRTAFLGEDQVDGDIGGRTAYDAKAALDPRVMVYKIGGAFFFGVAAAVSTVLEGIAQYPRTFILDMSDVPLIDTTAAGALELFTRKLRRTGTRSLLLERGQISGARCLQPD